MSILQPIRRIMLLGAATLAACASHEGRYAPACLAYTGSEILLEDGSFVWERYTDEARIDAAGNPIEPFPDFPKRGRYTVDGQTVVMTSETGQPVATMYLHRADEGYRLLTAAEQQAWESTGEYPDCVLESARASVDR